MKRLFLLLLLVPASLHSATFTAGNTSGICQDRNVVVAISVDNASGIESFQFELFYDPLKINAVSARTTTTTAGWFITANTESLNKVTVAAAGPAPLASGGGAIVEVLFDVLSSAPNNSSSALDLQNVTVNEATAATGVDGVFSITCTTSGISGDANGDGSVTTSDIFYLINNLFASGPAPIGPGDANGDGSVTTSDVFYLINFLFASGPAPR